MNCDLSACFLDMHITNRRAATVAGIFLLGQEEGLDELQQWNFRIVEQSDYAPRAWH